jgi:hypothetical protein
MISVGAGCRRRAKCLFEICRSYCSSHSNGSGASPERVCHKTVIYTSDDLFYKTSCSISGAITKARLITRSIVFAMARIHATSQPPPDLMCKPYISYGEGSVLFPNQKHGVSSPVLTATQAQSSSSTSMKPRRANVFGSFLKRTNITQTAVSIYSTQPDTQNTCSCIRAAWQTARYLPTLAPPVAVGHAGTA